MTRIETDTNSNPWMMQVDREGPTDAPMISFGGPQRRNGIQRPAKLKGSPQQVAFWDELIYGDSHILLEARAGTGKSTSSREGMWLLLDEDPSLAIRYCCFNKKVADEFAEKCPPACDAGTMHRFGNEALKSAFNSTIDKHKSYLLLDGIRGGAKLPRYLRKTITRLVELAKNHGLRPGDQNLEDNLNEYVFRYDIETWRRQAEAVDYAIELLARSAEMTQLIDFDDMLWLSVLHPVKFPSVDFLFIDECQDLNPVQHEMAEKLSGSGRTIIVGDPYQSIYAFRGADSDSIPNLKAKLDAKTLPLTVTFRCPKSHVDLARQLISDFEAAPEAPEGELFEGGREAIEHAQPGDLVLCRSNAPVIQACLHQITNLVPAIVRGRSIGDSLVTITRKFGDPVTIPDFIRALAKWEAKEIARLDAKDGSEDLIEAVGDKARGLEAVASACSTPSEIPGVINRLFSDDDAANRVTFSSVHRAKGSEARRVTYIQIPYGEKRDKQRPPQQWERDQRRNLRYVALTRSMQTLTLVTP